MQKKILFFKEQGFLDRNDKIALGQKCLDEKYRGKGIVEIMTSIQDNLVSKKYDTYMVTVKKDNLPSFYYFKRNSFILFYEDEIRYYLSKSINYIEMPMRQEITLNINEQDVRVVIRQGKPGDEFELHDLNKKWTREAREGDLSKGFLTSLYTPEEFRKIIDADEIVVAEIFQQNELIGWCLTNNTVKNEVYEFSKEKVESLKRKGIVKSNQSVALGLQWLIHSRYQRKGLIECLFKFFKEVINGKYDLIEASVRKQNVAGEKATARLGMKTVDEDAIRRYKIITT